MPSGLRTASPPSSVIERAALTNGSRAARKSGPSSTPDGSPARSQSAQ